MLELLLFRSIPRRDAKPLAKAILAKFGSFHDAIRASEAELAEVPGVGLAVAEDLKVIALVAQQMLDHFTPRRMVINSSSKALAYCRSALDGRTEPQVCIIMLDKRLKITAEETHPSITPRQIVTRALMCSAMSILIARWSPASAPVASARDVAIANETIAIAAPVGIALCDYLVIGPAGHVSLRATGLAP